MDLFAISLLYDRVTELEGGRERHEVRHSACLTIAMDEDQAIRNTRGHAESNDPGLEGCRFLDANVNRIKDDLLQNILTQVIMRPANVN